MASKVTITKVGDTAPPPPPKPERTQ
jgi:hypothetical protein